MKSLNLSVAFLSFISLFFASSANALGWEECKHLAPKLSPEKEAVCRANNKGCVVNDFKYIQCRATAPAPIQYVIIDGKLSGLARSDLDVSWRQLILPVKNVESNHYFSWPSSLSNVRIEYAYSIKEPTARDRAFKGSDAHNWQTAGVYGPGSTYTIIDYSKYIPASTSWPNPYSCINKPGL